jgi:hypothetical protein
MSYPPQPGQQPPGRYGPPPSPQPTSGYQGLGAFDSGPQGPQPPTYKKSNSGKIVAIVVIALLVLGGGGVGAYFLLKKDDKQDTAANNDQQNAPRPNDRNGSNPSDNDNQPSKEPSGGSNDPAGVQQAYIEAYESKKFDTVLDSACEAYKKKFGTSTAELEKQLAPYDIKASADGEPEVSGASATALINLEMTKGSETKTPKIKIKIVKESGKWKFCGEGEP